MPKDTAEISIHAAAVEAMAGCENYHEGAKRLLEAAKANPALMAALMAPYEFHAALEAVRDASRSVRATIWNAPDRGKEATEAMALAAATAEWLLDFPLPGGLLLRHAGKEELTAAAGFYDRQARDMGHKARWLERVAKAVPKGKTAGDVLTNAKLAKLQEDTRNG